MTDLIALAERVPVYRLRQWARRAQTLQLKASDLFGDMQAALGEDDPSLMPLVGDTMCSAAELKNNLKGVADSIARARARATKDTDK